MKILWFTNTPSNYCRGKSRTYNGGGWINSLESEIRKAKGVELGVAFIMHGEPEKVDDGQVIYYPIDLKKRYPIVENIVRILGMRTQAHLEKYEWPQQEVAFLKVVEDFKPDIIQVFGSERPFGLISGKTDVPVVLHIQGVLTPYLRAFLPPFVSWHNYFWNPFSLMQVLRKRKIYFNWLLDSMREQEIIRRMKFFIGRTDWDERVTKIMNPQAVYMYGSEVLRPVFYKPVKRDLPRKCTLVTTISSPPYKGFDMILNTAVWLKRNGLDYEWKVYGNIDPSVAERQLHIHHEDVHVNLMGVASSEQLKDAFLSASVYVHPSYIDNSPNSLCEAQILGCPVVATNVGGIPSLVKHGETGFLVPANDPFQMAYFIRLLHEDKNLNIRIGTKAREVAFVRHDPQNIVQKLLKDFENIIYENKG